MDTNETGATPYDDCVANCNSLFAGKDAALVACIQGCAKTTASGSHGVFEAEAREIQAEIEKLGRQEFLKKIRASARNAISNLPDASECEKLDPISRQYLERVTNIIESGLKSSDWDDSELAKYAQEVSWGRLTSNIAAGYMALDNSGGGGGPTCVTRCEQEYHDCTSENNCETGGWVCVCCVPCSLQYAGCVAKCVTVGGGFGGVVIA